MSDSFRTDQMRNDAMKLQLSQKHDRDVKEAREKSRIELERVIDHHTVVKSDLEKAYEVSLSVKQDEHAKRLAQVRTSNEKTIEEEKLRGEDEVSRIRSRYAEQISRYRANAEKQLEEMRRQFDNSAENARRTAEKSKV